MNAPALERVEWEWKFAHRCDAEAFAAEKRREGWIDVRPELRPKAPFPVMTGGTYYVVTAEGGSNRKEGKQ